MAVMDTTTSETGPADRFQMPLYTVSEAARYLGVPASTFSTWARGYTRRPAGRPEVVGAPVATTLQTSGPAGPPPSRSSGWPRGWYSPRSAGLVSLCSGFAQPWPSCRTSSGSTMSWRRNHSTQTVPRCCTTSRSRRAIRPRRGVLASSSSYARASASSATTWCVWSSRATATHKRFACRYTRTAT